MYTPPSLIGSASVNAAVLWASTATNKLEGHQDVSRLLSFSL